MLVMKNDLEIVRRPNWYHIEGDFAKLEIKAEFWSATTTCLYGVSGQTDKNAIKSRRAPWACYAGIVDVSPLELNDVTRGLREVSMTYRHSNKCVLQVETYTIEITFAD